jgi:hypothetical protein
VDEHQDKRGRGMDQSSRQQLPDGMPIPSLASIIASLDPGQFTLSHPIWKTALRGERSGQDR